MESTKFDSVLIRKIPGFWPHRRMLRHPAMYTQYLALSLMSMQLKKCLRIPVCDFALFILALISAFSVRQGVTIEPRYLNLSVNWAWLFPLFRSKFLGRVFWDLVWVRDEGKTIASVFDFAFVEPTCICSLNLAKWSWIVCNASFISVKVEKRKVPSSTYSRSSIWKASPFVVFGFGCRASLPYWQVELFVVGEVAKFKFVAGKVCM